MSPARVERCRVLELGCGDGGNLLPMAYGLPDSAFVGIDLAATAIARGRRAVDALGLRNLDLVCADVERLGADTGRFDFVIAHGVYSWVSDRVRDRVLGLCHELLAPDGVAFVSYNALPGGHVRTMLREMMLFDGRELDAPAAQVERARRFLTALKDASSAHAAYRQLLGDAVDQALAKDDAALLHDDLSPDNTPVYFHDFVAHAGAHGLQYLAEADFFEMNAGMPSPEALALLDEQGDDTVVREQYLDFLKCRRFRQTLLCHDTVALERTLSPSRVLGFRIASRAEPLASDAGGVAGFRGRGGAALRTDEPVITAALGLLRERWPDQVEFGDLLGDARRAIVAGGSTLSRSEEDDARVLGESLLRAYAVNLVEFHVFQAPFARVPGQHPRASALARLQAGIGEQVTTLRHAMLRIDDADGRRLLGLLDGTRDRAALLEELGGRGEPTSPELAERLDRKLDELARLALLEA